MKGEKRDVFPRRGKVGGGPEVREKERGEMERARNARQRRRRKRRKGERAVKCVSLARPNRRA